MSLTKCREASKQEDNRRLDPTFLFGFRFFFIKPPKKKMAIGRHKS